MTCIVGTGAISIVAQAEGVADLVRSGLGGVGSVWRGIVKKLVGEHPGRVVLEWAGERSGEGHPARGAIPLVVRSEDHNGAAVERCHIEDGAIGSDVDGKGPEVLCDRFPNGLNTGVRESRSSRHDVTATGVEGIPGGARDRFAVEVQVDDAGRAGVAV
ncbi:MAG: hypothetical protein OET79_13860 [Nitrospirota bacterium]|nr:hypothetical protein [Nitrospirota bacterium]